MRQQWNIKRDQPRRSCRLVRAVLCESLEQRRLLSTTFSIAPTLSTLNLTTTVVAYGFSSTVSAQGTSSLSSSQSSLTTEFSGTLQANLGAGTLQLVSGSSINALVNGTWKPGSNPNPNASNDSNATLSVPSDYGGVDSVPFFGTEYTALRNLIFDASSPVLNASAGQYATDGLLKLTATQGHSYYDGISGLIGGSDLTGFTDYDGSGQPITLQTTSTTETLTIPISINYNESISSASITTNFKGTLVATALLPAASSTLKLDADHVHLDLNTSSGGSIQFIAAETNSLSLAAAGGAGTITVDNSAGNVVPAGGLNLTGDGSTNLLLRGTGLNDSITQNAGQILFNGNPINFTVLSGISLNTSGGTDNLAVNSGILSLVTSAHVLLPFATVSIGSAAELIVPTPGTSSTRALLVISSLSIAGTTGNWTGMLDLQQNDLDLQTGSLMTASSQAGAGWQGKGITSSSALSNTTHLTTLGVIQNNQSGTALFGSGTGQTLFDNHAPGPSDILIKYTYLGDTDLSGRVDGSDYTRIDSGYLSSKTTWFNGDFNYDGFVNGTDYTLLDNAFNTQGAAFTALLAGGFSIGGNTWNAPRVLPSSTLSTDSDTGSSPPADGDRNRKRLNLSDLIVSDAQVCFCV